jgi:hypothetical protein
MLSTKQNMYGPQNHLVLSIVLEFLAFIVTIYLNEALSSYNIPTKTQDLLQSFHALFNAVD